HLTCAEARRDPSPKYSCDLVGPGNFGPRPRTKVRQETLIVEVKLTESCIPIKLKASIWPLFRYYGEIICQDQPTPHVDPSAPTWRLY
ncbi:MAG: hypothetical protein OEY28_08300, partial [Nitrospira sp.]|nr:hypothetical protein [Nitrospira sp.]